MGRNVVVFVVLALMAIQFTWVVSSCLQPVKASTELLIVPDHYPTIGAAVGNATAGDTVLVRAGTYYENPTVDKSLIVRSESPSAAVVIGEGGVARGGKGVFTLSANDITLEGFTIQSLNYTPASNGATGVMLYGDNCTISNNRFLGPYYAIFTSVTSSTTISGNELVGIGKNGIKICGGNLNTISNNIMIGNVQSGAAIDGSSAIISENLFAGNGLGLGLGASYSVIYGNNFTANSGSGIYFGASNCIVASNTFSQNKRGIDFSSDFAAPSNNTLYHNNFFNNTLPVTSRSTSFSQAWDNGSEGNYWSNYNGADADGDGTADSPYTIFTGNTDRYPLMNQFILTQGIQPSLPTTPQAVTGTVALWHFDETSPDGVTPDSADSNFLILAGDSPPSMLVDGKKGKAARFNGTSYGFANPSSSLDIQRDFTVDAWINVQEYKDVAYNIIFVECIRTTDTYPVRIWGFAINGEVQEDNSPPSLGALRGFVLDENGVFNEICTVQPVPLNRWVHVLFVRSLADGMQIYIDDVQQNVIVLSGIQNPTGLIASGTECYVGHDSISIIDELSVSNIAWKSSSSPLWSEWVFWAVTLAAFAAFIFIVFFSKRNVKTTSQ